MTKRRKGILCAIASATLITSNVVVPANAMNIEKVIESKASVTKMEVVNTSSLNIRKGPSTKYAKVGTAKRGQVLDVISVSNGWAKINYKGSIAYASKSYLKSVSVSKPELKKEMKAKVNDLNIRTGASTKYKIIGKLNKGDKVTVVQTLSNGWVKIEYRGGFGYVSNVKGAYLEAVSTPKPEYQKKEMIAKVNDLNIRTGASTKYSIIGKLNRGDKVIALEELSNGWVKVEHNGKIGYVSNVKGAYLEVGPYVADRESANKVISLINSLNKDITLADKGAIEEARKAYNALNDKAKALVTNLEKLTTAESKIAKLESDKQESQEVKDIITEIEDLGSVTLDNKELVVRARMAYDRLSPEAKAMVSPETLAILTNAEAEIARLEKEEEDKANQAKADEVIALIEGLSDDITLLDKNAVEEARQAYDALNEKAQALVNNLEKLTNAEAEIARLEEEQRVNQEKADEVIATIEALNDPITLLDKVAVEKAREAYDALNPEAQALVSNLEKLTNAESEITRLEEELKVNQQEADKVIALIEALNEPISLGDKDAVEEARRAYDALNEKAQALVNNLEKLTDAEAEIARLEKEETDTQESQKVKDIIAEIEALDAIALENKDLIVRARTAYDALSPEAKAMILPDTLTILTDAEAEIARLEKEEADKASAKVVEDKIAELDRDIVYADSETIKEIRKEYDSLTPEVQALVTNLTVLEEAESKLEKVLEKIESVNQLITNLPEKIALEHKTQVEEARQAYDALGENIAGITPGTLTILTNAELEIKKLETIRDNEEVRNVISDIEALPATEDLTVDDKDQVYRAMARFKSLPEDVQFAVDTTKLVEAFDTVETLLAQKIVEEIDALPAVGEIELSHKSTIEDLRKRYDELDARNNGKVTNLSKLEEAEAKIAELEASAKLEATIQSIIEKINLLEGEITTDNVSAEREKIDAIDVLLESIGEENKSRVTNIETLEEVRVKVEAVENDMKEAQKVIDMIDALKSTSEIAIEDKQSVVDARTAYEDLSVGAKKIVDASPQITKLGELEAKIAELESSSI